MKKTFKWIGILLLCTGVLCTGAFFAEKQKREAAFFREGELQYLSRTEGRKFQVYEDGVWKEQFLTGVNIGAGKPGAFPGELAISQEEYFRWFQYISDMNADVIRVYTTLKPDFYQALYEFNQKAERPLYLLQGVWINEDEISRLQDAYAEDGKILEDFIQDGKELVDIIHGNAVLPEQAGYASGTYRKDVSPYVIGWIMGIEWDPYFVEETDRNNPEKDSYKGSCLYTEGASPFEAFLCEAGDRILQYEMETYQMTRALSFANWPTTDMLDHPNEPYEHDDMAVVNMEHIRATDAFPSGLFASYHVYPYYPEFINYQKSYPEFRDETGKINTYQAYLRDLYQQHTIPVMVAEFGVPASRGKAHDCRYSGYTQGNHDEAEQGRIDASLLQDIYEEGYCGAMVFSWQDEWFKRTWNTMDLDDPDRRPFWSNPQTNEQAFGLLAFEPGAKESVCYVDGDPEEWEGATPLADSGQAELYIRSDEKYVYLMIRADDFDLEEDSLYLPVDILEGQGNLSWPQADLSFEKGADFLICICGKEHSRILVDAYYDSFYYTYAE